MASLATDMEKLSVEDNEEMHLQKFKELGLRPKDPIKIHWDDTTSDVSKQKVYDAKFTKVYTPTKTLGYRVGVNYANRGGKEIIPLGDFMKRLVTGDSTESMQKEVVAKPKQTKKQPTEGKSVLLLHNELLSMKNEGFLQLCQSNEVNVNNLWDRSGNVIFPASLSCWQWTTSKSKRKSTCAVTGKEIPAGVERIDLYLRPRIWDEEDWFQDLITVMEENEFYFHCSKESVSLEGIIDWNDDAVYDDIFVMMRGSEKLLTYIKEENQIVKSDYFELRGITNPTDDDWRYVFIDRSRSNAELFKAEYEKQKQLKTLLTNYDYDILEFLKVCYMEFYPEDAKKEVEKEAEKAEQDKKDQKEFEKQWQSEREKQE